MPMLFSALIIVFHWRVCSVMVCGGWVLVRKFCACESCAQQDPNTNQGTGGIKILALPFRQASSEPRRLTCSRTISSGVYTASPRRCQPPSPDNLTASYRVSSACPNQTLVFPNRSCTKTVKRLASVSWIFATSAEMDFLLKCQFLSVRSVTFTPLAVMCGIFRDMWLEPVMTKLSGGKCFPHFPLCPHWQPF